MPKNKVNNNIKLKSGGGVINDQTDGLSVDTGTTAGKIVVLDGSAKLPAVDGSQLTGIWSLISSSSNSSSSGSVTPADFNIAIPSGTRFIVVQLSTQKNEGSSYSFYTAGQVMLIPGAITSGNIKDLTSTSNNAWVSTTATITGSNVVISVTGITGGGGATAYLSATCYFFK